MNDIQRCLIETDVPGLRAAYAKHSPHLPQARTDAEALFELHYARTITSSIPLKLRAYSHRWLLDQGYPSGLPDDLKPRAERIYPVVVEGVGICSIARSPITGQVQAAMSDAVLECYADGQREPGIVRARMLEARAKTVQQLLGIKQA